MSITAQQALPRRIDTIERRKPWPQLCKERRLQIVRLFCGGLCIKRIAQKLDTRPDNISYAINKVMKDNGLETWAELGIWALTSGVYLPPDVASVRVVHRSNDQSPA